MGLFGKSLEEKTNDAVEKLRAQFPGSSIAASVSDKTVTLTGEVADLETKTRVMNAFNGLVDDAENTINQIRVAHAPAGAGISPVPNPAAPMTAGAAQSRTHEVTRGETLSGIAKQYYGNASDYMKIFNANRDLLSDPDKIQAGQKLKIPT